MNNAGNTFALSNATGPLALAGGTINGGNLTFAGSGQLILTSSGGVLNNVAVSGDLNLAASTSIQLSGTATFDTLRPQGNNSNLALSPGCTLSNTVIAEGVGPGARFVTLAVGGPGTVTIAPSGAIRHSAGTTGQLQIRNSSNGSLINNGLISAESTQNDLQIIPTAVTNNGTLRAIGGRLIVSPTLTNSMSNDGLLTGGT